MVVIATSPSESSSLHVKKMPEDKLGIWDWCESLWLNKTSNIRVCIEKVGGFIGTRTEGKERGDKKRNIASGHTMFTFGENCGHIVMGLIAAGFREDQNLFYVTPNAWHKEFGIKDKSRGETQTEYKRRIKAFAQSIFKGVVVTGWMADALLIAEYCRRKYG